MAVNVEQAYQAELAAKGFSADPAQLRAVAALSAAPTIGRRTKPNAPMRSKNC